MMATVDMVRYCWCGEYRSEVESSCELSCELIVGSRNVNEVANVVVVAVVAVVKKNVVAS